MIGFAEFIAELPFGVFAALCATATLVICTIIHAMFRR